MSPFLVNTIAANNANVRQFEQRYHGTDGIDRHYYDGPTDIPRGSDGPMILTNVESQIQADYTTAIQCHRRLVIDMTGWSRGAVIIATIAKDLDHVTLNNANSTFSFGGVQSIDVHWVGLFDAVNQFFFVAAPHQAWASVFSGNIQTRHDHLIKTSTTTYQTKTFPTEMGFQVVWRYNLPNGAPSTHADVGYDAATLAEMIRRARAHRVPVR